MPYLFIVGSTVTPGTCTQEIMPLLDRLQASRPLNGSDFPHDLTAERFPPKDYHLVYKPELIALGTVINDLQYPDVVLVGASSLQAADAVKDLYSRILGRGLINIMAMKLIEAELAKISLNCAITQKISLANQIGMVAEALGADPRIVLNAVGSDSRIGHRALKPGLPFAGPCFPRDNRMFQFVASKAGRPSCLSAATDQINEYVLQNILRQIPVDGAVGILGQAYKPGTCITDESPGIKLRDRLLAAGRIVKTHDFSADHGHEFADVLKCPTVVVATAWPGYADIRMRLNGSLLIDPMGVVKEEVHEFARQQPT